MNFYLPDFQPYIAYLFVFFRIAGMLMAMPILGTQLVPQKSKLILSLALTIVIAPSLNITYSEPLFSLTSMIVAVNQILIGVVFGTVLQIIFQAFILTGQLVAMQMGLGFASMMDPQNGVSVAAVGQIYLMMVTLLFLSVNGHLVAIQVVADSFQTMPIGFDSIQASGLRDLVGWASWMFTASIKMALPAICALFVVNMAFGVMTKAAPQLNIFSIGFPMTMVFGIIIIWFSLITVLPGFEELLEATYLKLDTLGGMTEVIE